MRFEIRPVMEISDFPEDVRRAVSAFEEAQGGGAPRNDR